MKKNLVGTKNLMTRDVWIKSVLESIPPQTKILDAGAGERPYKNLCKHLDYHSQDFCQYEKGGDGRALQADSWDDSSVDIVSDITKIPVDDNSFDTILCTEVFEHIVNPELAVKEFSRILKKGGNLVLTAPFASLVHYTPHYYYSGFSKEWYVSILGKYGFNIEEINYNGNYFEYLAQEIRRLWSVGEKYSFLKKGRSLIYTLFIKLFLLFLNKLSLNNKNSEELLCFGIHILASKKE